ncbi:MAG: aldose 1-epimerase family protein [Cytophagales bacterium]|nr:aldose 1-epimerase family protein [Cytophagales bacterium]
MKETIFNDYLEVSVKQKGAELCSLINKETGIQHVWQADPKYWAKHSPILFPVVGVVDGGIYTYKGVEYPMSKHGFARDHDFELATKTDDTLVYRLVATEETKKMYPFDFELLLTYKLERNALIFNYKVVNKGNVEMYFSLGGHPAFTCPFLEGEQLTDYVLKFEKKETVNQLLLNIDNGLFTGKEEEKALDNEDTIALTNSLFDNDALVYEGLASEKVSICTEKNEHELTFDFSGWKYLAFWSQPTVPYVCIEPWLGLADFEGASGGLTEKTGIEKLEAQETHEVSFSVTVK